MRRLVLVVTAALLASACAGDDDAAELPSEDSTAATGRCIVRLHGKGGTGADDVVNSDGVLEISPAGNADGWGGRQWLYFPDEALDAAVEIVRDAAERCDEVIVNGFSNGGAFAAKLYCRGENLGGRLVRVVVDDPVPDAGVEGCTADPGVGLTLYWTGALDSTARPGWDCADGDWTCEGGTTIGIDAYAAALDTAIEASVHDEHAWFRDAPSLSDWTR
jgi:pimeloyl-ACP methyl ester carboxylesterase